MSNQKQQLNDYETSEFNQLYNPKTLAWHLYNDSITETMSSQIFGFGPTGEDDIVSWYFEIFLSVFLELMFNIMITDSAKIIEENESECFDDTDLEPDYEDFDMGLYLPIIEQKFKKISLLVRAREFERYPTDEYEKEDLDNMIKRRYCRIILRHNYEDTHYFDSINSDDFYDFIPNEGFEPKTKLRDVYAILRLNNTVYQIYFDNVERLSTHITNKMF